MNLGCSSAQNAVKSPTYVITAIALILLTLVSWQPYVYAIGTATAALAGTEIATTPSGITFNPAAVVAMERTTLEIGAAYPFGLGNVVYLAFYEPKDPAGRKAALSGMLGLGQTKHASSAPNTFYTANSVTYQIGERVPLLGAFGLGLRYMQDADDATAKKGSAWRLDAGWQGYVGKWLTLGVTARDVLGTNLEWSDHTVTRRKGSLHAGVALHIGSTLSAAADFPNLLYKQALQTWSVGLTLQPISGFTLRGGYRQVQGVATTTAGAGVQLGRVQFDVAATIESEPTGSLSLSIEL